MQKVIKRGFTLIELLVVIAIIGILAGIVLASLGTARTKGQVAAVKEQMNSIRSAAEIYYNSNGNAYGTAGASNGTAGSNCAVGGSAMWADSGSNLASLIPSTVTAVAGAANLDCGSSATAWSVAAKMPDGTYWCVDSTGVSKGTTGTGSTAYSTGLINAAGPHSAAGVTVCS